MSQIKKKQQEFFASSVLHVEDLLAEELRGLGAKSVRETRAGVAFTGTLETAYRACLWSRVASRILLPLKTFKAGIPEELYAGAAEIDWSEHLTPDRTLAVDCSLSAASIRHSGYAAQVVKDAVVDHVRKNYGRRPTVSIQRPDVQLNLYLHEDDAVISVDLSGESLHRRAYRQQTGEAPLKENIAAALLLRAHWPQIASAKGGFVDPLCGSGTLLIEAAMIAADCPPGLRRSYFGFLRWKGHDQKLWKELWEEGRQRFAAGCRTLPPIVGYDHDQHAVRAAGKNVTRASLEGLIRVQLRELEQVKAPEGCIGLVAANPPYGERLDADPDLPGLYAGLGRVLKSNFSGWKAAVLTGHTELARSIGLQAFRRHTLYNGTIKCTLVHIDISPENRLLIPATEPVIGPAKSNSGEDIGLQPEASAGSGTDDPETKSPGSVMFANRLRKNRKRLRSWIRSEGVSCYRVYDADMPEYAVAVDVYENTWVHLQEYAPPPTVEPEAARKRLQEVLQTVPGVLGIDADKVYLKTRQRQRGSRQYTKMKDTGDLHEVQESGYRFLVNFSDYLDTGLFLDHRLTRHMIHDLSAGRSFLNLYCYTGSATVYAIKGGATKTTSVDSSRRYLEWAGKNLALNRIDRNRHELVQEDCLDWLRRENNKYGLIFLDPPTFSNSKDRKRAFDVQGDHVGLIDLALKHLEPEGVLIFSCNYRKFRLDQDALSHLRIESLTEITRPPYFSRRRAHQCWKITF